MNLKDQLDALLDATAFDSTGTKVGAVRQVYVDDTSGKMTFATVATGIFSADAIVPLHGARLLDDELHVDHTRSEIRDSPRPDRTEDGLTPDQEFRLLEYYGIDIPAPGRGGPDDSPTPDRAPAAAAAAADSDDDDGGGGGDDDDDADEPATAEPVAGDSAADAGAKKAGAKKATAPAKPTSPAGKSKTPGQPAPARDS